MRTSFLTAACILISSICVSGYNSSLNGDIDYLGEKKPGLQAELFAPGIVSTGLNEFNAMFSPDGNEFYFSIRNGWNQMIICFVKKEGNKWSSPEIAPFSGKGYMDADPFFSKDGSTLFFCSSRPAPGRDSSADWNIWSVKRNAGGWSEPEYLSFNTPMNEMYVSVSDNGKIYFHADYENTTGRLDINKTDIYCSRFDGKKYLPAEKIGGVSSQYAEWDPFISPDESYIIFTSVRPGGLGSGDLYICFKNSDGSWGEVKNMGSKINSSSQDYCPSLSPDGKYFFFSSYKSKQAGNFQRYKDLVGYLNGPQNGSGGDIYWIDSSVISSLK